MAKRDVNIFKSGYQTAGKSRVTRLAHALDWAAVHYKGHFVQYNILSQGIHGYSSTPRLKAKETEEIRKALSRVRPILLATYGRGMVQSPGVGVRATVDAEDAARNDAQPILRRFVRMGARVKERVDNVNVADIPKTKANASLINWLQRSVKPYVAQITDGALDKLLPPVEPVDGDDKDKK